MTSNLVGNYSNERNLFLKYFKSEGRLSYFPHDSIAEYTIIRCIIFFVNVEGPAFFYFTKPVFMGIMYQIPVIRKFTFLRETKNIINIIFERRSMSKRSFWSNRLVHIELENLILVV